MRMEQLKVSLKSSTMTFRLLQEDVIGCSVDDRACESGASPESACLELCGVRTGSRSSYIDPQFRLDFSWGLYSPLTPT